MMRIYAHIVDRIHSVTNYQFMITSVFNAHQIAFFVSQEP